MLQQQEKPRHSKQQSSVLTYERDRKKELFGNKSIFTIQSNSVIPSSRKHNNLDRSADEVNSAYLPNLKNTLKQKSHSIKPTMARHTQNAHSSQTSSQRDSKVPQHHIASNHLITSNSKSKHLDSLSKMQNRMQSVPSQPTILTEKLHTMSTPYKDHGSGLKAAQGVSRNFAKQRSESDERLEEWSQIFSLQHNRWQDEFDDLKARFLTDFEKQKLLKQRKPLPQAKPSANFQIPNEYLSLEKRTVKDGQDGIKERLRRDKLKARQHLKPLRDSIQDETLVQMRHDSSVATIQAQHAGSSLEVGRQHQQYMSQRDLDSSFEVNTSLNASTSLGKILFGKEETRKVAAKVKLPSIHKKNLKNYEKSMQYIKSSGGDANKLLSASSANARSVQSTHRETDSKRGGNVYSSINTSSQQQMMQIQQNELDTAVGPSIDSDVTASQQMRQLSVPVDSQQMRIQVNQSSVAQSPGQIGDEIRQLFKSNPDGNPFQIMLNRNRLDLTNAVHERQQMINRLTQQTKSVEQAYLDAEMRRSQSHEPVQDLAKTINLNINMTINQYGTIDHTASRQPIHQPHTSMESLFKDIEVNDPTSNQKNLLSQNQSELGMRNVLVHDGENLQTAKQRIKKQIRISRRQMLEPLKVASKLQHLTAQSAANEKKSQEENDQQYESLLDLKEKMGQQKIQIGQVRQFVDSQIDNDIQRTKIKKSLEALQAQLVKQGLTLREVVDRHTADLLAKANKTNTRVAPKLGSLGERGRVRFETKESGFDFIQILQCSATLRPLLQFQQGLKVRSKKRHQRKAAALEARHASSPGIDDDEEDEEGDYGPMAHLKKRLPQFKDQDESIAYFIDNVKKLIFLNHDESQVQPKMKHANDSDYNWVDEPEMYQSSSGESKYSNEDRDMKDHLAVGKSALQNTMRKYKNADKIVQMNEVLGKDDKTSHLVKYYQQIGHRGQIPKSLGMVHRKTKPTELNAGQVQMTDEHSDAIANGIHRANFVNKLILKNVGLKDNQALSIIRNMNLQVVRHLDISDNPLLTKNFYRELCELLADNTVALERIEIEGNNVGDQIIHEMCTAMVAAKKIVYLNVSKNNITDAGARSIALLIQECPTLRLLFMHYNRILGFGGTELAEAIGVSKSLQVLDVSYNSLCGSGLSKKKEEMTEEEEKKKEEEKKAGAGKKKKKKPKKAIGFEEGTKPAAKGFGDLFTRGFSENWSDAFSSNQSLLHVDMSHNHLEVTDVEIMAEGLKENQSILGIHFAGNYGDVDNQGFVKPGVPLSLSQASMVTRIQADDRMGKGQDWQHDKAPDDETEINNNVERWVEKENSKLSWLSSLKGGVIRDTRSLELKVNSNCWICEGWSEHHFKYLPGKSDDNPNHDNFKPIKLHLDIDHFEGDLMMLQDEEAQQKVYDIYRMLPPGPHRYFYSVDGKVKVAKDQNKTVKKEKKEKKLMLDLSKLVIPPAVDANGVPMSTKNTPKKGSTPSGMRAKEALPEAEPLPDYYELDLPEVNYIENIAQNKGVFTEDQISRMNCVPRPGPKGLGKRSSVRTPWDFSLSVFALYKPDTTSLLNNCFEKDWNRTKVDRIVKNDEERERLKTYVRSIYKWFREVYKFYSGSDPMNDIFCIGVNVFSDLIGNQIPTLIDGKTLKLSDLDLERIQTNANETNGKFNPKNNMVRHNFLEVFMRLCDTKYMKNKAGGPECDTITKAFKIMFDNELYDTFKGYDSQEKRKNMIWKEDVDYTLKISLDPLKMLYKRFIGKNSLPGGQQYMSLTEFTECIIRSDCLSKNFGAAQIGNQYNQAMMTQVDEIEKDKHINMTFVEFLDALVRVAEKVEIPHCVLDEFEWGADEIDPDMRDQYSKRDLLTKLQSLILFMIKGSLTTGAYTKYIKTLDEYKEAGSVLWANDLDVGNVNLNQKKT